MSAFEQSDYLCACGKIEIAYNAVKRIANDGAPIPKKHPINKVLKNLKKAIDACSEWGDEVGMHANFDLLGDEEEEV